ncbi:tetratricopeptide repeat protein [candidate division KSB1 bacterium]|nr:tetratricopeptide repeat protein [candidate division KSB1 bacterium]
MIENPITVRLNNALELKRLKHYEQAFVEFEKIIEEFQPTKIDFCLSNMAHIQYLLQRYEQAQKLAEQSLSYNPKNWFSLGILGEVFFKKSLYDEARQAFQEAHQLNPGDIYFITRLSKAYEACGQQEMALTLIQNALLQFPNESQLYNCLGDLFKSRGEIVQAKNHYLKAIELNSENHYAFRQWVSTLAVEKSKREILAEVQKLIKLPSQANNSFLREYYSNLLKEVGRSSEATSELEAVYRTDPRNLYRKTRLANQYNQQGQHLQVIELLEADFTNGVVDQYLFIELAKAYLALQKTDNARKLLILAIKSFPNSRPLRELLMKVR